MNSTGLGNTSLLGSSAGFNKRKLLRPASGMLSKKVEFLRSIDASQSQPMISTFLRGEVAAIEEEINLMDKDRMLRQGETGLQKGYVTALRKWLQTNQSLSDKEDDDSKVLRYLGVENYEAGFRKLWKILGHLDLTICKISELQVIHFLLYDQMFNDLGKDSPRSINILSQISNSNFSPSKFQITQILLDRSKDIYAACKQGVSRPQSKHLDDRKYKQQTNELIKQLKNENTKLSALLEQLSTEQQKKTLIGRSKSNSSKENKSPVTEKNSPLEHLHEIQEKYKEHIKFLNSQKNSVECSANELKSKISRLQSELKMTKQSVISNINFPSAASGSYEQTLMEEMEKMKKGFEKRIAILTEDFAQRERELRRKQSEFKSQNEKIKWQRSLLLKKFDLISA